MCEVPQPENGYIQSFPTSGPTCPDGGIPPTPSLGHDVDLTDETVGCCGADLTDRDFGNHKQQFQPPDKSGMKFDDKDNSGSKTAGDTPIQGWAINLYKNDGFGNFLLVAPPSPVFTDINGNYVFPDLAEAEYRVCESSTPPAGYAGYVQTYPNAGTQSPNLQGETTTNLCPAGNNTWGWQFTTTSGINLIDNDFGNWKPPVECQKETVNSTMDSVFPGNLGPDFTVRTWQGDQVQDAVNAATNPANLNADPYIIIMVIAHSDGSLGGTANQKVLVSADYGTDKPFGLFGCSVTLTGGGTGSAVKIATSANAKDWPINGRTSDIFLMDLHGDNTSNSGVGVEACGQYRYLRNEYGIGNATGIKVIGSYNTVHNGKGEGNSGDGVYVSGNYNYLTDTDSYSNGGNGFKIIGGYNQLMKLDTGEKNKGNTDGVNVVGNNNTLSEIDAYGNSGDGIDVAGTGNQLNKNNAGDSNKPNGGYGFRVSGGSSGSGRTR